MPALFHLELGCVSVISVPYALPNYNPLAIHSFLKQSGTHQLKAAGVGAQGEPNHCGSNVTGLSLFPTKKSTLEAMVYIIQHIQWFFLFQGNV